MPDPVLATIGDVVTGSIITAALVLAALGARELVRLHRRRLDVVRRASSSAPASNVRVIPAQRTR